MLGVRFREGTCDELTFHEVFNEDVYRMASLPDPMPANAALDLGANVGAWTLRAAQAGCQDIVAVEPMPANAEQFRQNMSSLVGKWRFAMDTRVNLIEAAVVGNDLPEVAMVSGDPRFPSITFQAMRTAPADAMWVQTININRLLLARDSWWCVKIDIEGAEFNVFRGVDLNCLTRVDYIVMEFHGRGMGNHCAWIDSKAFGDLVTTLSEWGSVQTLGSASRGGMLYGWRYGVAAPRWN